jgi:hypothetical protein
MIAASRCDCLICHLETTLVTELSDESSTEQFRAFSSSILFAVTTPFALIQELHDHSTPDRNAFVDEIIYKIVSRNDDTTLGPIRQKLLLLAFIPTVHRTTSQVAATFPSLARDDIAQHIFSVLLEFFDSKELSSRRSHLAFAIARKIRRSTFRWAIHEARHGGDTQAIASEAPIERDVNTSEEHSGIVLRHFLDTCQRDGLLDGEERSLLLRFKLEGATGPELARNNGHSAVAIRHRVQRVIARLRKAANGRARSTAKQLNLFG